jgi:ATP-binding cassette subfamily B multidrug efflux pump
VKLFIQLGWFFRQQWHRYLMAISLLIIVAGLQLFPPKLVGLLVDDVVAGSSTSWTILRWVGLLVATALLIYILRYFWRLTLFGASYQLAVQLRNSFYQRLSRQAPNFYLRHRTGDLIARATNDVDRVVFAAGEGILTMVDSLIMGCAVLIIMSSQISWQLTLLSLLPMPIMAFFIHRYGKELHARFRTAQEAFSSLNDQTQDSLSSIRMIKSFGLEQYQSDQFTQVAEDVGRKNMNVARVDAKFDPTIYLSVACANMLAVGGGSWMVVNGTLTLGELTSFIMYLGLMIWPMLALAWMFNIVERGSAAYVRISALLTEPLEIEDGPLEVPAQADTLTVAVERFQYPESDRTVLTDINLTLTPGKTLGVCGATGSGKSTLLALIQRSFDVSDGEIYYSGKPLGEYRLDSWRSKLAVVSQTSFLFSATIAENIALGKPDASYIEIERVAKLACVHDDILQLAKSYDTQVGERGVMLSGGQKQRIAIARALLTGAEILILDDALSAVDGHTEHQILANLNRVAAERTLIISAHRLSALVKADEIVVLHDGGIVQRGTHESLIKQRGWYHNMYRYQQLEAALDESDQEAADRG